MVKEHWLVHDAREMLGRLEKAQKDLRTAYLAKVECSIAYTSLHKFNMAAIGAHLPKFMDRFERELRRVNLKDIGHVIISIGTHETPLLPIVNPTMFKPAKSGDVAGLKEFLKHPTVAKIVQVHNVHILGLSRWLC